MDSDPHGEIFIVKFVADGAGGLVVNHNDHYWTKPARLAERNKRLSRGPGLPKTAVIDVSIEGVVDHEVGHLLNWLSAGEPESEMRSLYAALNLLERDQFHDRFSDCGLLHEGELLTEALVLWRRRPQDLPTAIESALRRWVYRSRTT
ncbi:MAG: hypothetical protein HUU35_11990 [Armatimonadetes bacterium]|nr:hypothetical protein [Armatimonadota bacterium]